MISLVKFTKQIDHFHPLWFLYTGILLGCPSISILTMLEVPAIDILRDHKAYTELDHQETPFLTHFAQ